MVILKNIYPSSIGNNIKLPCIVCNEEKIPKFYYLRYGKTGLWFCSDRCLEFWKLKEC